MAALSRVAAASSSAHYRVAAAAAPDLAPAAVPSRSGVVTSAAGLTEAVPAAESPINYIGHKAFDPVPWAPPEILLFQLQKRKKYANATCLPEESLENDKVSGIIKPRGQRQNIDSYSIYFQLKTFKSTMLPVNKV
jgi:hypothetical protein